MRILVFQQMSADVRIAPERDARTGRVRAEWQVGQVDPADARALDLALDMKSRLPRTEVVLVHLGSPEVEPWLREGLAQGADRAVRIWDAEAAEVSCEGAAVILAAAAQALGFDLALTGAAGATGAGGQMGVLLAQHLGVPCVAQALSIDVLRGHGAVVGPGGALETAGASEAAGVPAAGSPPGRAVGLTGIPPEGVAGQATAPPEGAVAPATAQVTRGLARGLREIVEVSLPAVVTVLPGEAVVHGAPMDRLLAAQERDIPVWDLARLGVPGRQVWDAERPLCFGRLRPPDPRLRPVPAPDPTAPAFERIGQLVRGSVRRREGTIVRESGEAAAEAVFQALLAEGWLDHLRGA